MTANVSWAGSLAAAHLTCCAGWRLPAWEAQCVLIHNFIKALWNAASRCQQCNQSQHEPYTLELRQSNVAPRECNTVALPENTRSNGFLSRHPAEPRCFEYRLGSVAGWFIIAHHNFPQDPLSINWGTILVWLSDGIWEQVQKERIRLLSCRGSWAGRAHMQNGHKQDGEWGCTARQSGGERTSAVKDEI